VVTGLLVVTTRLARGEITDTETMETMDMDTGMRRVGTVAARAVAAGSMVAVKAVGLTVAATASMVAVVSTEVAEEDFTGAVVVADTVAGNRNIEPRTSNAEHRMRRTTSDLGFNEGNIFRITVTRENFFLFNA